MSRRSSAPPSLAAQRLKSAHGRLVYAAWRIPARNRYLPSSEGRLAAVEVLVHLLDSQDEAVRRVGGTPSPHPMVQPWEVLMERLESGHLELCRLLRSEPPEWFGELTYEHYARHIPDLEAWHASAARG
jgi:hypothetical protein